MARPEMQGVFVPHVTPLNAAGEVDVESLASLVDYLCTADLGGLVSCARVGEGPVLAWEEKLKIFEVVAKSKPPELPLVATVAPSTTEEAKTKVNRAAAAGADAAMIIPPLLFAWGQSSPEMRYQFFADLDGDTDIPLVLFQVPIASYWYDADTIARISHLESVVAVKEASFNVELFTDVVNTVKREGGQIALLSGNDQFLAQSMLLGIDGALVGVANIRPDRWVEMFDRARQHRYDEALALQEELLEVKELTFRQPIVEAPARIKYWLQREGVIEGATVRRPQLGIDEDERRALDRAIEEQTTVA